VRQGGGGDTRSSISNVAAAGQKKRHKLTSNANRQANIAAISRNADDDEDK